MNKDRRSFLRDSVLLLGSATLLAKCKIEPSPELPAFNVTFNHTAHIEVNQNNNPIGLEDIYVYSSQNEQWAWFTLVFNNKIDLGHSLFYLSKVDPPGLPPDWLGQPEQANVPESSVEQALADLTKNFPQVNSQTIGDRSIVISLIKPRSVDPYTLVYRNKLNDQVFRLKTKLIFQQDNQ